MTAPTYHRYDAFECSGVTCAAGGNVVAIGTVDGDVEMLSAAGRTQTSLSSTIVDVAAATRLYAATATELVSISQDGTRIWSRDLDRITQIAATDDDTVGVLTDDDKFYCIDGETGAEQFSQPQPWSDIPKTPSIVGTASGFLIGVWSFVTHLDGAGDTVFESNLDGAFRGFALVDDCVVVAMRNDSLLGLDATSGEQRWSSNLAAESLVSRGAEWVLAVTAADVLAVAADGTTVEVNTLPGGHWLVGSVSGEVVAAIGESTITAFHVGAPNLSVAIDGSTLVRDRSSEVPIMVTNDGEEPRRFSLEVDASNAVIDGDARHTVDLEPGGSTTVTIPVTPNAATATFEVGVDERVLAEETVYVRDHAALDPAVTIDEIKAGTVAFTLSGLPGTPVTVSAGGRTIVHEEAVEEFGGSVPWRDADQVTIKTDDQETVIELGTPAFRDVLGLGTVSNGVVPVTVSNPTSSQFSATLLLEGTALDRRLSRTLTLDPEESIRVLVIPPTDGILTVGLEGRPDRLETSVTGRAGPEAHTGGRERAGTAGRRQHGQAPSAAESDTFRGDAGTESDASGDRDDGVSAMERDVGSPKDVASESVESPPSAPSDSVAPTGEGRATGSRDLDSAVSNSSGRDSASGPTDAAPTTSSSEQASNSIDTGVSVSGQDEPLEVTRELVTDQPAATVVFRERLTLSNQSQGPVQGRLTWNGDTAAFDEIPPNETRELHRLHAVDTPGPIQLPPVTVEIEHGDFYETMPLDVQVADPLLEITGELALGTTPPTLRIDVTNRTGDTVHLDRMGSKPLDVWMLDEALAPGASTTWSTDIGISNPDPVIPGTFEYTTSDQTEKTHFLIETITGSGNDLTVAIGDETQAVERGPVVATITNNSDTTLTDVHVEATGDVDDLFYTGSETIEALDVGETIHHEIRLGKVSGNGLITLTADHDNGAATFQLAGPVVADVSEWSDADRQNWEVSGDTEDTGGSTHLQTAFIER